jgi:hypothetical protein
MQYMNNERGERDMHEDPTARWANARRARKGAAIMAAAWRINEEKDEVSAAEYDEEIVLVDLLANLEHWAFQKEFDFEGAVLTARNHFRCEEMEARLDQAEGCILSLNDPFPEDHAGER